MVVCYKAFAEKRLLKSLHDEMCISCIIKSENTTIEGVLTRGFLLKAERIAKRITTTAPQIRLLLPEKP
jgi:hypothetical protein